MTRSFFYVVICFQLLGFGQQALAQNSGLSISDVESSSANTSTAKAPEVTPPAPTHWRSSYTSLFLSMDGTQDSKLNGFYSYGFGPITMKLQYFNLAYQLNNGWSLAATPTYMEYDVFTKFPGLGLYTYDSTEGFGDTPVVLMTPALFAGSWMLMADFGFNLPTGSINEQNPAAPKTDYAYNMQLGSGTLDPIASVTAINIQPSVQSGARASTIVRDGGNNNNGYRLGNVYKLDAWADYPLKAGVTPRLVGNYTSRDGLTGADYTIPRQVWTEYYYHTQVNYSVSAALRYQAPLSRSINFAAEAGIPLYQNCVNYDDVVVSTLYYGSLSISGNF